MTQTATITVGQATLTVTAANASRAYGAANPAFTAAAAGAVNGDTFTLTASTTATASALRSGTYAIVPLATGTNLASYTVVYVDGTLTVGKATPVVTWANPAGIAYGTALSSTQLDAVEQRLRARFVYTPAAGAILPVGTDTLSVTFTPTDTTTYTSGDADGDDHGGPGDLDGDGGQRLARLRSGQPGASPATAAGAVNGDTFTLTASTTATAPALRSGTYAIVPLATGSNLASYTVVYVDGTLTVGKATPVVTWANPAGIATGRRCLRRSLTRRAATPGTFVYTPAAGAILPVGTDTLSVTFTPADTTTYTSVTQTATITVGQATLTVTAANASRAYGAANPAFTATAAGAVNGDTFTLTASTTATASSPVGTYAIVPLATGSNLSSYTVVYVDGTLTVGKATPVVTWANPAGISYGTALSSTQLDASSTTPGTLRLHSGGGSHPAGGHGHALGDVHPGGHDDLHQRDARRRRSRWARRP